MIDLSKALDSINHPLLLKKLEGLGVHDNELNRFTEYLSRRKQRVVLGGKTSVWADTEMGVPQGSILGPLLFTVFVNDMREAVKQCTRHQYADEQLFSQHTVNHLLLVASWKRIWRILTSG